MRGSRGLDVRLAAVDQYRFPLAVRQRLAFQYGGLSTASLDLIEAGARQWFRLHARSPKAKLSLPAAAVDVLWREAVQHTQAYQEFCGSAFGKLYPYAEKNDLHLHETLKLAQEDEGLEPHRLPVLFQVDVRAGLPGARRYLADCGGRGLCYEDAAAVTCVQHLRGQGRRNRKDWTLPQYPQNDLPQDVGGA